MRQIYYFFIIPFIFLNFVQDTLGQSVNELAENFYYSSKFLESYFGINEKNKSKIVNKLKIRYDNTYFRSVLEQEVDFHRSIVDFQNFEENEISLNNFINYFHYISEYVLYDYSQLNQFKIKKIKNQHKLLLEKPISSEIYYARVAFKPSSDIPYNFETGIFEIDLSSIEKNIARYYIPNLITKNKVPKGYSELHISTILFSEMPKMLRLVVKDVDQAEKFSNEDIEFRVNFELTDEINMNYTTADASTQIFDLFLQKLKGDLARAGRSTDLSDYSQAQLIEKFYEAGGGVMLGRDAYSRKKYFGLSARIKSLELKSNTIGTHMWKASNWFEHVDENEFQAHKQMIERAKLSELERRKNEEATDRRRNLLEEKENKETAERIRKSLEEKKNEEAAERIRMLLKENPKTNWSRRAQKSFKKQNYNDAIESYRISILQKKEILSITPISIYTETTIEDAYSDIQKGYFNIGYSFSNMGLPDSAMSNYLLSIIDSRKPKNNRIVHNAKTLYAIRYKSKDMTTSAIHELSNIIENKLISDLNMCWALNELGTIYSDSKQFEKAYAYYEKVINVAENTKIGKVGIYIPPVERNDLEFLYEMSAIAYFNMAELQAAHNNYKNALVLMKNSINFTKSDYYKYRARLRRGAIYSEIEDYKKSIKEYKKAIDLYPKISNRDSNPWGNLGWSYYLKGDYKKSVKMSREGFSTNPEADWIKYNIAVALLANGKYQEAEKEYREAKEKFGIIDGAIDNLKDLFTNKKRAEKAKYILTEILGVESE